MLRYQLGRGMTHWLGPQVVSSFPWATLAANVIGDSLTLDRQGRLLACEHGNRRVSRTASACCTSVPASVLWNRAERSLTEREVSIMTYISACQSLRRTSPDPACSGRATGLAGCPASASSHMGP